MPQRIITFDHFFQQSPLGLAVIEARENGIRPNPKFCQLLGYSETELQAMSLPALIHPQDYAQFEQTRKQALQNPAARFDLELRFICKNEPPLWLRVHYQQFHAEPDQTETDQTEPENQTAEAPVECISVEDISELKAAQETLQQSESRIKRVLDAASIGLYDWNVQTDESYWDDKTYELLNLSRKDHPASFDTALALLPEAEGQAAKQKMQRMLEQGGTYETEYSIHLPDGSRRHILSKGKITERNEDGTPSLVSGVLTDITALKQAQEEALHAQARLSKVLEANLIGMLIFKKDGTILEANRAFLDLLGFSRSELEAGLLNWRQLTPPDYQHVNDRNEPIIAATGVMPISEKQYFHKNGHRVDVILAVAMFEDAPDTGVGFILDNTRRKQYERYLQESEENWRFMANFLPHMMWMADVQGNRYWYNQRWFDFTGTTLEDVKGSQWLKLLHPDHRERVLASIQRACDQEEAWEASYLLMGKDSQYHWFLGRAVPIRDGNGTLIRWLGTSTDITELHDTQEALLLSQRQLQASNRDLEDFASIASHDLQAPLRKALTFCDMICDTIKDKVDDSTLDLMNRAKSSLENMQSLVSDILELARISQEPERFETVDLNEPLQQALANLSEMIQETEAEIHTQPLPKVYGDPVQLTQLIQNLIQNAIKYQPKGQRPLIHIQSGCYEKFCELQIRDNGIGFPAEYATRLFKPFERLHGKASPYKGTGIGLTICQRIVERHHGAITAESSPNNGATFTVHLPIQPTFGMERANWHSVPKCAPSVF